jgi:hypothetical protein
VHVFHSTLVGKNKNSHWYWSNERQTKDIMWFLGFPPIKRVGTNLIFFLLSARIPLNVSVSKSTKKSRWCWSNERQTKDIMWSIYRRKLSLDPCIFGDPYVLNLPTRFYWSDVLCTCESDYRENSVIYSDETDEARTWAGGMLTSQPGLTHHPCKVVWWSVYSNRQTDYECG